MSADGSTFRVNVESLSQSVGGLTSQEEVLLGRLLALFPIPRPEHAGQLLAAIGRIAASVPWFEAASGFPRSEEHTSELQSLMRILYAVFCLKKKKRTLHTKKEKTIYSQTRKYT